MSSDKILALIPARGGSKGLPRKNLAQVAGKTLVELSVRTALHSGLFDRIVVSTDQTEIAEVAELAGAEVPFLRSESLASDCASVVDVALDGLRQLATKDGYQPAWLALLQPTSPLRQVDDLRRSLSLALESECDAVVSITKPDHHPLLSQIVDPEGFLKPAFDHPPKRRQDLPKLYAPNGAVYWIRPSVLDRERTFYPSRTLGYVMPANRSVDVDTESDLELCRTLIELSTPDLVAPASQRHQVNSL